MHFFVVFVLDFVCMGPSDNITGSDIFFCTMKLLESVQTTSMEMRVPNYYVKLK